MKYAFIDLEVLVPTATSNIEHQLEQIDFRTSFNYLDMENDPETFRQIFEERQDLRNQIFEGVGKYRGKLDFKSIFNKNNVDYDRLDFFLNNINCPSKFVIFYYNTVEEKKIKEDFIKDILPSIVPFGVKYYTDDYSKNARKKNSIASIIKNLFNLSNLSQCTFIVKSEKSCSEFKKMGAINVLKYDTTNILADENSKVMR